MTKYVRGVLLWMREENVCKKKIQENVVML